MQKSGHTVLKGVILVQNDKIGSMVLKGVNRYTMQKSGQMVLKGVIWVHNDKIRLNGLERSQLDKQYNKNHGFGSKTEFLED